MGSFWRKQDADVLRILAPPKQFASGCLHAAITASEMEKVHDCPNHFSIAVTISAVEAATSPMPSASASMIFEFSTPAILWSIQDHSWFVTLEPFVPDDMEPANNV
jgi:hypothetical protein